MGVVVSAVLGAAVFGDIVATGTCITAPPPAAWLVVAACCMATLYALFAALTMPRFGCAAHVRNAARRARAARHAPVSVLKPLCGTEPRLFDNLASFCEQNHPCFQLLFGVSSAADPAIAVVRQLQSAYPHCDIELVIDSRVHGSNLKVSNLINMRRARVTTRSSSPTATSRSSATICAS
jgi:ceramide glucosyltransferase